MPEHNYPDLPDPPPDEPQPEKPIDSLDAVDWSETRDPKGMILDLELAGLRALINHFNEIQRLREVLWAWNAATATRGTAAIDHDDIGFLLNDLHWLKKRIEAYRKMLMQYKFYRDRHKKPEDKKPTDGEGSGNGVTT